MSNEQAKSLSIYVFKIIAYLSLSVCGVLIADSYKSVKDDVKEIKQKVETRLRMNFGNENTFNRIGCYSGRLWIN